MCASGGCLSASLKCNGEPDCVDGSDEVKLYYLIQAFELHNVNVVKTRIFMTEWVGCSSLPGMSVKYKQSSSGNLAGGNGERNVLFPDPRTDWNRGRDGQSWKLSFAQNEVALHSSNGSRCPDVAVITGQECLCKQKKYK